MLARILSPDLKVLDDQVVIQFQSMVVNRQTTDKYHELSDLGVKGFSQWGEDGIIEWLVSQIPGIPKSFVEFGVEDYVESNTRMLLYNRNWRGMVIDGSSRNVDSIMKQSISWKFDLAVVEAFITRENINSLIQNAGLSGDIGLLSVDIDGNDYWVWEAIDIITPAIVVCEYNATFGDLESFSVPYQPDFERTKAHFSNLYFGASLAALVKLGKAKGYRFVGTNLNGCNAFFVRNELAEKVINGLDEVTSHPSVFAESRDLNGKLTFLRGSSKEKLIGSLPVYDFGSQSIQRIDDYNTLCSENWLRE